MKKLLFTSIYILVVLFLLSSCSNNTASIKGELKNADKKTVYLEELNIATRKLIDSSKVNNGNFSFKYKFTKDEPNFIILRTDSVTLGTLLIEKNENINYSGDLKRPSNYTIQGSKGSELVKGLNSDLAVITAKLDSIDRVFKKAEGTDGFDTISQKLQREMTSAIVKHKQSLVRFIAQNPKSFASFTALYQRLPGDISVFGLEKDMLYYKVLLDSLSTDYPNSHYVQILRDDYERIEKSVNLQNMLDNAEIAEGIPDIELIDKSGNKTKLSSLRGKYVLLDFWSAANTEMLLNNRELVDIYNKYKSRNFEIFQVNVDQNKTAWLDAISNQNIQWISVMDTPASYAIKLYNITRIPSNYLLNEKGEIIEKNLYGDNLDKRLNAVLPR